LSWGVTLFNCATGNFTAAATWCLVDATSYIDSQAGTVVIGASNVDSPTFVPGAITVDGVAVKVSARNAAPGANTFTVTLRNSTTGVDVDSVTINVSDIEANIIQGWYFFDFGASYLLTAGENYIVRCVASAAGMVTLYRSTTGTNNMSRMLRTTTTQAPAANDQLHIGGEWTSAGTKTDITVTMDNNNATSFGPTVSGGPPQGMTVGKGGTLDWVTAADTQLVLKGDLAIYSAGIVNIGTAGTPIDVAATADFQLAAVANVDSAIEVSGTFNAYGDVRGTVSTLLTADLASGTAVVTVGSTTDWEAGDELAFASTTRTYSQAEKNTILTVDSPTQVTMTANLANSHSGTAPTQGEVINLTRNLKIHGVDTTHQGYVYVEANATVNVHYIESYYMGSGNSVQTGWWVTTTSGGSCTIAHSSFHDYGSSGAGPNVQGLSTTNFTFDHNVFYELGGDAIHTDWQNVSMFSVTNNVAILTRGTASFRLENVTGTITGNTATSSDDKGILLEIASVQTIGTFSGNTAHSNNGRGFEVDNNVSGSMSTLSAWRNGAGGITFFGISPNPLTITDVATFGNANQNFYFTNNSGVMDLTLVNWTASGDSTFSTPIGIDFVDKPVYFSVRLIDSSLGVAAGIYTAHTTADININAAGDVQIRMFSWDTTFASATTVANQATLTNWTQNLPSGVWMMNADGSGSHRRYLIQGTARTNTVTFRTATPSEELIPNNASIKLQSGPKQAAVASGNTVTWSVWVYKSVGYAGAQPRLMLRANPAIGINSDTLLDTMAGGSGAWEELTGVTAAAAADGVFEAFVDCDTSGSIYVDDWSAGGVLISENRAWWDGNPMIVAGGEPIGGDAYWWTGLPAVGFPPSGPVPGGAVPIINNPILISRRQGVTQ
jgi:hypothetical protein